MGLRGEVGRWGGRWDGMVHVIVNHHQQHATNTRAPRYGHSCHSPRNSLALSPKLSSSFEVLAKAAVQRKKTVSANLVILQESDFSVLLEYAAAKCNRHDKIGIKMIVFLLAIRCDGWFM